MSVNRLTAARVFARDGFRCRDCGSEDALTIDHIIPLGQHGTDDQENLQTLCRPCNCRKGSAVHAGGTRTPVPEFVSAVGILSRRMTAARLGLDPDTVTDFVRRGVMPPPDGKVGRAPYWFEATIAGWETSRRRLGRPRKDR